ncbi:MAG: HEAT repeat domain-containing protein, partial [Planctomycetia bacterium]
MLDGHVRTGGLMPILVQLGPAAPCGLHVHSGFGLGREFAGNAFACGFNTRTVSRHVLTPQGATYATLDTPFLTADSADFHPTDVIEDADGTLLICDTGGWYKLCCPTSQLEKPAVSGGVYRVRRLEAPPVEDPRGLRLEWDETDPAGLVRRLGDPRPAVAKRAADMLARLGAEAVPRLAELIAAEDATATACRGALWTLSRIDGIEAARAAVRPAVRHRDPDVRHVAAVVAGLHRDRAAVADLAAGVRESGLAGVRAAAEALGRIGGAEAVDVLLALAAADGDRVLRHTLIYALIECGLPEPVLAAAGSVDPRVRLVALGALDQMGRRGLAVALPRERVIEACRAEDADLRESALWIAAQHPEWAGDVAEVFAGALAAAAVLPRPQEDRVVANLAGLAVHPAAADAFAAACQAASPAVRGLALTVMRSARMRAAPESWIGAIGGIAARGRAAGDAAGL